MDATLHALGEILLKSIPTFLLVIFLNFYLKAVFFKPMDKVLGKRYEATEGAKKRTEQSLARAAGRTAEYEAAMRSARAEVYQAQEKLHRESEERRTAELAAARQRVEQVVEQAKADLERDMASAKAGLAAESETLANQIAESILRRSAA
jgi:F-type H+-transporting ATPase subunit b